MTDDSTKPPGDAGDEATPAGGDPNDDHERGDDRRTETGAAEGNESPPPLDELTRRIAEERRDGPERDPFEAVEVADISAESAWAALEADDGASDPGEVTETDVTAVETVDPTAACSDRVVPKTAYCQRCRYFSAPPAVACAHRDAEIVEVVDSERFRVRSCPMVDDDDPNRFE